MPNRSRYSRSSRSASGGRHALAEVEPGQRADPVDAVGVAQRLVVGELQVRVVLGRLADEVHVPLGVELVGDDAARRSRRCGACRRSAPRCRRGRPGPGTGRGNRRRPSTSSSILIEQALEAAERIEHGGLRLGHAVANGRRGLPRSMAAGRPRGPTRPDGSSCRPSAR